MTNTAPPSGSTRSLGLALSGGGSRAAAFHRGTLQAMLDLNLVDRIQTVSTVSGGSLFGGAWMSCRAGNVSDKDFLQQLFAELNAGFVMRSVRLRLIKTLIPGLHYTRTNVIAETFNKIFFHGMTLKQLPLRPNLCLNVTVVNNGQVGKFSRLGFSAPGLRLATASPKNQIPMENYPLSNAVAASAAFPVGLPPLQLRTGDFPEGVEFIDSLKGVNGLSLTDGGVLENLGIQTLLKSPSLGTWDMVVSDAGTAFKLWKNGSALRSFGVWALSGQTLDQMMLIMNDKQNRWARQQVVEEIESTWLADAARTGKASAGLPVLLSGSPAFTRRQVLFVRVDQNWKKLLTSIPAYRLQELAGAGATLPNRKDPAAIEQFLTSRAVDLRRSKEIYAKLKDDGADEMNSVGTNFTGLSDDVLNKLAWHAAWQVHATHAIYGL
jgi:predicted acylesterase/phospholipase RssA